MCVCVCVCVCVADIIFSHLLFISVAAVTDDVLMSTSVTDVTVVRSLEHTHSKSTPAASVESVSVVTSHTDRCVVGPSTVYNVMGPHSFLQFCLSSQRSALSKWCVTGAKSTSYVNYTSLSKSAENFLLPPHRVERTWWHHYVTGEEKQDESCQRETESGVFSVVCFQHLKILQEEKNTTVRKIFVLQVKLSTV